MAVIIVDEANPLMTVAKRLYCFSYADIKPGELQEA